mgnify:FL=1
MEFAAYVDEPVETGDSLSLHRQRILAAQIKDSELGDEELLLPSADTLDNSVENVSFYCQDTLVQVHLLNFCLTPCLVSRAYLQMSLH